jgi:hypothetical protein
MNKLEVQCVLFIEGHENIYTHYKPAVCAAVNKMIRVLEEKGYGSIVEEMY